VTLPGKPPTPLSLLQVRLRSRVALVGVFAAWLVIAMLVVANFKPSVAEEGLSTFDIIVGTAFAASVLLWVVMILEFLRERPTQYPWLWGFLLMTGPVLGPLLFYYRVWRPRHGVGRPNTSFERTRER
jgi:hypothetical protein